MIAKSKKKPGQSTYLKKGKSTERVWVRDLSEVAKIFWDPKKKRGMERETYTDSCEGGWGKKKRNVRKRSEDVEGGGG